MTKMNHVLVATLFCLSLLAFNLSSQDRPPNIIYIMADDLGYGHLGSYGQEKIKTPHLDRMAAEGMRFTQSYAGSHVCRPSRSTLMTGKHAGHTAIRANGMKRFLYDSDVTVAELLKTRGYATGGFGKWGLGDEDTPGIPMNQGFDEWWGQYSQVHAHFYYPYWIWHNDKKVMIPENFNRQRGKYVHDLLHEKAKAFIRKNQSGPFFAYLPYIIPHVELVVPEESELPYRGKFPKVGIHDPRENYIGSDDGYVTVAGMISRLDKHVGEIFSLLKELKIDKDTLVIFTSDNGAQGSGKLTVNNKPGWQDMTDFFEGNGELRGYKGQFFEGGIRVPLIARWPEQIEAGSTTDHLTAFWDWLPTAAEIAGVRKQDIPNDIDGLSYLPTLLGKTADQKQHAYLYWEYPYGDKIGQAVRMGNWKGAIHRPGKEMELYNLKDDISETNNLATSKPDVVEKIQSLMAEAHIPERDYKPEPRKMTVEDFVQLN
jgi:arylsulfatase A